MSIKDAIEADRSGDFEAAAELYERIIQSGASSFRVLVDLAILYWQATDPGVAAGHGLSAEFMNRAAIRKERLLDEAIRSFPNCNEAQFWKRYIAWADMGEPLSIKECEGLLRDDRAGIVPAMFIFMASGCDRMIPAARQLLRQSRREGTAKARYVASVIEASARRAKLQGF